MLSFLFRHVLARRKKEMCGVLFIYVVVALFLFQGCLIGGDFSWIIFLPALTGQPGSEIISKIHIRFECFYNTSRNFPAIAKCREGEGWGGDEERRREPQTNKNRREGMFG
ncbi:hypothetical protein CDAR_47561 [Caerostris darwini]|uniref:Secreted protein n=1 Tax=Caerostris darwini TaxID=1538125 RepID=A0AAV4M8D8_9ARAC|nr:hypothetical protein CDAR_47561 [Caerostris darwini]